MEGAPIPVRVPPHDLCEMLCRSDTCTHAAVSLSTLSLLAQTRAYTPQCSWVYPFRERTAQPQGPHLTAHFGCCACAITRARQWRKRAQHAQDACRQPNHFSSCLAPSRKILFLALGLLAGHHLLFCMVALPAQEATAHLVQLVSTNARSPQTQLLRSARAELRRVAPG